MLLNMNKVLSLFIEGNIVALKRYSGWLLKKNKSVQSKEIFLIHALFSRDLF